MYFYFNLYKKIKFDKLSESIFYSIISYKNKLICFALSSYMSESKLLKSQIDNEINVNDNIEMINDFLFVRPTPFIHKNNLYIVNKHFSNLSLYDVDNKKYIKFNINKNNFSFISHNDELYFIYSIKPFILYKYLLETDQIIKLVVDNVGEIDNGYVSNTCGYKFINNIYYGYGNNSYLDKEKVVYDIFMWTIDFNYKNPHIEIYNIKKPSNSKNIFIPTSIYEYNYKSYLVSFETNDLWFVDKNFETNIYEITN
jgi:hypothetical protein